MNKLRNYVAKVVNGFNYIGMAVCFVMVFVVAIDVILRKLTNQVMSINGSNEFSQYFLVVMCMLAIPMLQLKKGHVWVDMFVMKFPYKLKNIWLGCVHFLETLVSAAFTYGCFSYAMSLMQGGRATDVLNMPWWPFAMVCAVGFLELTVLFAIDTIIYFQDGIKGDSAAQN